LWAAGWSVMSTLLWIFDRSKKLSLIRRAHLENLLTDILGIDADLADRAMATNYGTHTNAST
jgi:hypothetical protein